MFGPALAIETVKGLSCRKLQEMQNPDEQIGPSIVKAESQNSNLFHANKCHLNNNSSLVSGTKKCDWVLLSDHLALVDI